MDTQSPQNQNSPQTFMPNQEPQTGPAPMQYTSGKLDQAAQLDAHEHSDSDVHVSWSASEFVSHEKNGSWFAILIASAVIVGALTFFITKEWTSIVVVAILALAFGIFANLRPRVLEYSISPDGVAVGERHFEFDEFKSFSVSDDAIPSIQLLPQKRFMVAITLYLDPQQVDAIIDTLGEYLPFEHRERDLVDKLTSRIRF